ncbi:class I SAM-dependent methyltransferase [Aeromicrobium panaciterrae]|uniref:class I SAM-dependent methyltransferase n=1 Tax=Aeromicrobium panaciterrae TaxID=363861 RepID=UPI0031D412AA
MRSGNVASRTAVLVCQARAVADGRLAPGRFDDPVAARLLNDDERVAVEEARSDTPPDGARSRMQWEMLRATAEVMVPRTIAIDDAVRERANPQVVILGAGLDGRAWRMPELTNVLEVDHPASQQDKRERAAALTPLAASLRFVPVDFGRDGLAAELTAAGHDPAVATTWIWEGVVSYLARADVISTMAVITARSAPGSRVVINYQAPSLKASVGRWVVGALTTITRQHNPLAGEPTRSTWSPDDMAAELSTHGFPVTSDHDLLTLAGDTDMTVLQRSSLQNGRVVVADYNQ